MVCNHWASSLGGAGFRCRLGQGDFPEVAISACHHGQAKRQRQKQHGAQQQQAPAQDPSLDTAPDPDADLAAFMSVVLASTEDLWASIFGNAGHERDTPFQATTR